MLSSDQVVFESYSQVKGCCFGRTPVFAGCALPETKNKF